MLRRVALFDELGAPEIAEAVQALETQTFKAGDVIYRQDEKGGDSCFFVMAGECNATSMVYTFDVGLRVKHEKHGKTGALR